MITLLALAVAHAESWCATPLVAHEWGVHVIRADGAAPVTPPLPSWFHDDARPGPPTPVAVRDLPPDSGVRALPVVQWYAGPGFGSDVPVALEVGFLEGSASSWWPAVDRRVTADAAGSVEAQVGRQRLQQARAVRTPMGTNPPLGSDPTKQLVWDRLALTPGPTLSLRPSEQPWVDALRAVPSALWVGRPGESDRFVYYEATTRTSADVTVERARGSGAHVLHNRSDWDVHDLVVIADGRVWTSPRVPHGTSAELVLDRPLDRAAVVAWLRERWTDPVGPPVDHRWQDGECVMMRDPAVPVERAAGHRLYGPEVDVLIGVWADRLLGSDGPRLVYREDPAALDARMPLAVYTDMYHYVELVRLGIVLVEGTSP